MSLEPVLVAAPVVVLSGLWLHLQSADFVFPVEVPIVVVFVRLWVGWGLWLIYSPVLLSAVVTVAPFFSFSLALSSAAVFIDL
jgi:hypothetical protein